MATAYVATGQAWAAAGQSNVQYQRRPLALQSKASSWRPPVTLFVKMEFGISFGGGSPSRPHKFAINYPAPPSKRTPRFLTSGDHVGRRAASADTRRNRNRNVPIPRAIAPANVVSTLRRPIQQPQSSIAPHESASQTRMETRMERPLPRRSSSLNVLAGSQMTHPPQLPHPERRVRPRSPPKSSPKPTPRRLSRQEMERKPLPEVPSRFRLGEDGLPWESPHIPPNTDNVVSPEQQSAVYYQQFGGDFRPRSASNPNTPVVSPMISPESSYASMHMGAGHSRGGSWAFTSPGGGSQAATSSSRTVAKGKWVASPPPLCAAPPNIPLPPVPRSPKSHVYHAPLLETPQLEPWTAPVETEDDAIRRELQEANAMKRNTNDPVRARELGELNVAMVGFDALDDRFYEPLSPSALPGASKGGQSLGWAVRVEPEWERFASERDVTRRRRTQGADSIRGEGLSSPSSGNNGGHVNSRDYYLPVEDARRESVWQEYSFEDWETGGGDCPRIERRRSWTSGEALEWQAQLNAITYS